MTKTPEQMIIALDALTRAELRSMIFMLTDYDIPTIDAAVTAMLARRAYEEELAARPAASLTG
jgi:hypothetical protein